MRVKDIRRASLRKGARASKLTRLFCSLVALAMPLASGSAGAGDYAFTRIDGTNPNDTYVLGMNNIGQLVGYTIDDDADRRHHGFMLDASGGYFQIDVPEATDTEISGINDYGQMVGRFVLSDRVASHGFLLSEEVYTTIEVPSAQSTFAYGINNAADIVGVYLRGSLNGFLLRDGEFTTINVPGNATSTNGINDAGQIVGFEAIPRDPWAFVRSPDGQFDFFVAPGADYTRPYGINGTGQAVGTYRASSNHGFLWSGGALTTIDVPGADGTVVTGINDDGEIVGYYYDQFGTQTHGFRGTPR